MGDADNRMRIDPELLVARLNELETQTEGDIARIIELLLVENQALRMQCSRGLHRGRGIDASTYPRFLEIGSKDEEETEVPVPDWFE